MTQFATLLRMRIAALRNRASNLRADTITKGAIVAFGLGTVITLGLMVSYVCFEYVEQFPAFGAALNGKMISLLFFTLFILVVLSTIIVAYTTVFLARETDFLFQHPIPPGTILALKLGEAIAFSSWATLFLCLPVLISFGWLRKSPLTYYLEAGLTLVIFLLFSGLLGTSIALILAPLVRRLSGRQLLAAGMLLLGLLGWIFLRSFNFWSLGGENDLLILDRFMSQLSTMHSPYFPGQWASAAILAATAGHHAEVAFQASTLLANTLIFLPLLGWYSRRLYGREWLAARDPIGGRIRSPAPENGAAAVRTPVDHRTRLRAGTPLAALLLKDGLLFLRDPAQLSQSLLFVLLMVIYSLSLIRIPPFHGHLQVVVYFANLGAVCMILSSFTSRFIFPLISLEGRAFWIVGLAPITRAHLVRQKLLLGLGISLFLGLATIIASNTSLRSPPDMFVGAVLTVLCASLCLTALATGLGAAYPMFDEDNPARISVGLGGTLNFFASALSVGVLIAIEALPYVTVNEPFRRPWTYLAHAGAVAFTTGLTAFCFRLGARSLARRDF